MIREYRPPDRDALYSVCFDTTDGGRGGAGRYADPRLLGEVFVGPYLRLQPQFAFVVDDGAGPEGYVLGALDTPSFAADCEREWWPDLRRRYRDVVAPQGMSDPWLLEWIRHPPAPPDATTLADYPSHLHIDLLPRWRGGGWGRRLLERLWDALAAAGSRGVHLEVGASNSNAVGFYRHVGFVELRSRGGGLLMGRPLASPAATAE